MFSNEPDGFFGAIRGRMEDMIRWRNPIQRILSRLLPGNSYNFPMNFLIEHHDVGQYAGYKTQVFAWYFYEISDESDIERLVEIYAFAQEKNLSILILSGGTNTLFSRDVFP